MCTNQRQLLMKNLFWFLRQHFQPAFYLTIMWERHLSTTLKELVDKILTNFKIGRKKLKELEKINSKCYFHLLFLIPIILILCLAFCFASQIDFWLIDWLVGWPFISWATWTLTLSDGHAIIQGQSILNSTDWRRQNNLLYFIISVLTISSLYFNKIITWSGCKGDPLLASSRFLNLSCTQGLCSASET